MPKEKLNFPGVGTVLEMRSPGGIFQIKIIEVQGKYYALNTRTNIASDFNNRYAFKSIPELLDAVTNKYSWAVYVITD